MPTLAQTLGTTTPVSPLLRKARRLGIGNVPEMIALAASRGCHHYACQNSTTATRIQPTALGNDELTILLIIGENPYEPSAIRCAAQLVRSPDVDLKKLAKLAVMEKCERVLAHITRAGLQHDPEGRRFWQQLLSLISPPPPRPEPHLPHWSRFVSMPGIQRSGPAPARWLTPYP